MADNEYQFPVRDTLEAAWQKVSGAKATIWAVFGLVILNLLFFGILGGLTEAFVGKMASQIPTLIGMLLQVILFWGLIYIGIQRAKDLPIQYTLFKSVFNLDLFFKMLGVYILQILIAAATVVIILPVFAIDSDALIMKIIAVILSVIWYVVLIYVLLRMFFAKAIVIDKRINPWVAIKMSFAMTKGNVWHLFCFGVFCVLALMISLLPFGIGLIWSLPFIYIAYGLAYRRMLEAKVF